jgi:PPIC-type PPIASE domain
MPKLFREPLLHFLVLGAVLFGVYGWLNRGLPDSGNEIVVSRANMRSLQAQFERVWQRAPTAEELQGLIDNWVREEILYREGMVMGLDRGDPVVRRRIAQKVEFIVDGATPPKPTETELQSWLDANSDTYRIDANYSLRQVYFDPASHGDKTDAVIAAARRALERGAANAGDSTMLPGAVDAPASEVARIFGGEFEGALRELPVGGWQGPVRSGFGLHLVELRARESGRNATLDEVRTAVERDLLHARMQEAKAAFYDRVRSNYSVLIEGADSPDAEPAS